MIKKLLNFLSKRVGAYGAQYRTFAVFGIINYPLAYFYEFYTYQLNSDALMLRLFPTILCLGLFFKDYWPNAIKQYLPLYWYASLMISIPMIIGYMVLKDNFSLSWLINAGIGFFILVLLVDSLMFLLLSLIGIIFGASAFYILHGHEVLLPNYTYVILSLYIFTSILVLGGVFSKNKEIYNDYLMRAKDDFNLQLDNLVHERTKELEIALSAKKEFLNNIVHEIRTPLVGIIGLTNILHEDWEHFGNDQKYKLLQMVRESSGRLEELISNILDLSKFDANKMELKKSVFDLLAVIYQTINQTHGLAVSQNKEITISVENYIKDDNDGIVFADYDKIKQVLYNLISNAIKYSEQSVSIIIAVEQLDDQLLVSVEDNGVGIPLGEESLIFEIFTESSKTKTHAGGKGLGLALCQQIILSHGGRIWALNNKDYTGSTFCFTVPRNFEKKPFPILKGKEIFCQDSTEENDNIILIVDDSDVCLANLAMILRDIEDYRLVLLNEGLQALKFLNKNYNKIKLVFLDLIMPDINGREILDHIKMHKNFSHIKVIIQSGSVAEDPERYVNDLGAFAYIIKPYRNADIMGVMRRALLY